jgi:hydrogenase maturation factor
MCVAYPAQVLTPPDGATALVARLGGSVRTEFVLLAVIEDAGDIRAGDWLLVQSGLALARLEPTEAAARLALLETLSGGEQ